MVDFYSDSIGLTIEQDSDADEHYAPTDDLMVPLYENSTFVSSPHGKAYATIRHMGVPTSELMSLLSHICRAEILSSIVFIVHGSVCPLFWAEPQYETVCHMNVVAGIVGILTGGFGLGAVCRHRSRRGHHCLAILYMLFCIISAVAMLLVIVNAALWLVKLSEVEARRDWSKTMAGLLILFAVAMGVCFIISSTFVCAQWNANSKQVHVVGTVTKPNYRSASRVRYRATHHHSTDSNNQQAQSGSTWGSNLGRHNGSQNCNIDDNGKPYDTGHNNNGYDQMQYHHVCTSRCNHSQGGY